MYPAGELAVLRQLLLFFLVILHFLLIQKGQLSVSGKSKRTKYWSPIQRTKYIPRKSGVRLTDWLDITLLVCHKTPNQTSFEIRVNNLLETVKFFFF